MEDFSAAAIACICLYGVVYFAVCLRMVWDEILALVRLPGRIYRGELKAKRKSVTEFSPDLPALELQTRGTSSID